MDGDQVSDEHLLHAIGFVLKRNRRLLQQLNAQRDRDELDQVARKVVEHFRICGYRTYGQERLNHGTTVMLSDEEPSEKSD